MSAKAEKKEEGAEGGKKKGGKLPIILALVLVLGGGGFFMMKGKGKEKKEPEIKLGKEELEIKDEFTVNLSDGLTYARFKVGFAVKEGFTAEEFDHHAGEVADAVISVIKSTKKEETLTEAHLKAIKKKIATKLNKMFAETEHKEQEEPDKKEDKKEDKKKKIQGEEERTKNSDAEAPAEGHEIPEGWDSAKGPILKVFFKAFATQ